MKHINSLLALALAAMLSMALYSCRGTGLQPDEPDEPEVKPTPRTVLVYMVATNSLGQGSGYSNCDVADLKEMAEAADKMGDGRLLVYHAANNAAPVLKELKPDGTWETLVTYPSGNESLTVERMKLVVTDMKAWAPAEDYGLILWSHASGWIEAGYTGRASTALIEPKSFGVDGSSTVNMSIPDLAAALDDSGFSFIYFDCCHMATVEVAYELRGAAKTMVASGTELPIEGMPYHLNIPAFFAETPDLVKAATNTYNYYADGDAVWGPDECYISVIDLTKMDALAEAMRKVMATGPKLSRSYIAAPYMRSANSHFSIFDLGNYINALPESDLLTALKDAYTDVVTYYSATPRVYGLDTSRYSGLGTNIVSSADDSTRGGYDSLQWWTDVVSANPDLQ